MFICIRVTTVIEVSSCTYGFEKLSYQVIDKRMERFMNRPGFRGGHLV